MAYKDKLEELEAKTPEAYQSNNTGVIDNLINKITNRESFSYDFNADPLYQQYKDQYTKMGKEASMNAVANASALTGGYGSSYAATAGAQANQQYLTELNNVIPELYNAAMQKYQMEGDELQNQYAILSDDENRKYQIYRDTVSDYQADRNYYASQEQTEEQNNQWQQSFDYQKERDAVGDNQWQQSFEYQKERDTVADTQWQTSFDYQKERDAVEDSKWKQEFDSAYEKWYKEFTYQQDRDKVSDEQWQKNFDRDFEEFMLNFNENQRQYNESMQYQKDRDAVEDNQWQQSFDYNKEQDAIQNNQWQQSFDYQKERDEVSDAQWQAEMDQSEQQFWANYNKSVGGSDGSGNDGNGGSEEVEHSEGYDKAKSLIESVYKNQGSTLLNDNSAAIKLVKQYINNGDITEDEVVSILDGLQDPNLKAAEPEKTDEEFEFKPEKTASELVVDARTYIANTFQGQYEGHKGEISTYIDNLKNVPVSMKKSLKKEYGIS